MQLFAELLTALGANLTLIAVSGGVFLALLVAGAAMRGRSPAAGAAVAMLGVGVPVALLVLWLGGRGLAEMEMAAKPVRAIEIGAIEQARPERGHVTVKGFAQKGSGMLMKYGFVVFGSFGKAYCYPVTSAARSSKAPLVACSYGRGPGGQTEETILEGVIGMRSVPPGWSSMFSTEAGYEIRAGAPVLEEGVPAPTKPRGIVLVALAALLALGYVVLFVVSVRRRRVEI
jgi:hypothetical protein